MPTRPDKKAARAEIRQLDTFTVKAALRNHLAKQSLLPVIEERVHRLHLIAADTSHLWGKYVRHRHASRKDLFPKEFLRDYTPEQRMERTYEFTFFRQFVAAAATGCRSCPDWLTPVLDEYKYAALVHDQWCRCPTASRTVRWGFSHCALQWHVAEAVCTPVDFAKITACLVS